MPAEPSVEARAESEHSRPTAFCPQPDLWQARDAAASEVEVGDFLYALVRLMKPMVVVETGSYLGDTSAKIRQALQENGRGAFHFCDTNPNYCGMTGAENCTGLDLIRVLGNVDLAFIDSGRDEDRRAEIQALHLAPDGIVAVHDYREKSFPGWNQILLHNPRGLILLQKE